ncbi:MAG: helix-turn-helix domain-containing protein [Phycisphaerae bacterium]|nr:XRE family transcriptional regulator [Tepidisphaeraceae bacterium]
MKKSPPKPAEVVDPVHEQLCTRVRDLRKRKNWTLEDLSAACGVSKSMLSQVERGEANPTLAVAFRIARAFGLSIGELVESPDGGPSRVEVIRGADPAFVYRADRQCRIRTLSPLHLEKSVEFYEVVLKPGGTLASAPHFKGARELATVQSGAIRITSGDESSDLAAGDSAHYPADVAHAIRNAGDAEAVVYLVVTYAADA